MSRFSAAIGAVLLAAVLNSVAVAQDTSRRLLEMVNPPAVFAPTELVSGIPELSISGSDKELLTALVCGDKQICSSAKWPAATTFTLKINGAPLADFNYWSTTKAGAGMPFNDTVPLLNTSQPEQLFQATRKFTAFAPDDSTFAAKAKTLSDGLIELSWTSTTPREGAIQDRSLWIGSTPYGAFEGLKLGLKDKTLTFSPAGVSPGKRSLFSGKYSGPLTFYPDQPEKSFTVIIPEETQVEITENRAPENVGKPYQYGAQISILGNAQGNLRLLLDIRKSSAESLKVADSYAGINFWRSGRLHIPDFAHSRNLIQNSSFEGGLRYWNDAPTWNWNGQDHATFAVDNQQAYRGKHSLCLSARKVAYWQQLSGFAIPCVPGKSYTFSFYGRADDPNISMNFAMQTQKWGTFVQLGAYRLTKEWVRYSKTFTVPNNAMSLAIRPEATGGAETARGWVDAIQIEESDKLSDYAEEPVAVTLLTAQRGNYLRPGQPLQAKLHIRTPAASISGKVVCEIEDFFYRQVFATSLDFTTGADGESLIDLPLDGKLGTGIYIARTEAQLKSGEKGTDFHRISIMNPAPEQAANKAIFANIFNLSSRFGADCRRYSELGFGSVCYEHVKAQNDQQLKSGLVNVGTGIISHGLSHEDEYSKSLVERLTKQPYSDALRDELEQYSAKCVKDFPWINDWFLTAEAELFWSVLKNGDDEGFVKYILASRKVSIRITFHQIDIGLNWVDRNFSAHNQEAVNNDMQ